LIYVGSYDWICNWLGNQAWTLNMEWSGKEAFGQQPLQSWLVDGKAAGKFRSANGLTFATVDGAGHMVSLKLTFNFIAMPTQIDRSRSTNPKKHSPWYNVG
jgi:carboxypeptidase C (cathepsin A)